MNLLQNSIFYTFTWEYTKKFYIFFELNSLVNNSFVILKYIFAIIR